MSRSLSEIEPDLIKDNPFKLFGSDWMLITAGTGENFNTMTASWGGFGVLWEKNVCYCFIRPNRFTYEFTEKADYFTLSFFDEQYRSVLDYCGSRSGRDVNKIEETELHPVVDNNEAVYFSEARLVIICKKLYFQDIEPGNFIDPEIANNYPQKDYHRMYIGEIKKCLMSGPASCLPDCVCR